MEIPKEKAAGLAPNAASDTKLRIKSNTKKASILKHFVELGERGMTCFEAANRYHDYVLRSTVSGIQRDFSVFFLKERVKVPNSFGTQTDCVRYWLDPVNRTKAIRLLESEASHV
jgi:hypothetical protein